MSLRTYQLISHPAYLDFIERSLAPRPYDQTIPPVEIPTHKPKLDNIFQIADYLGVSPFLLRYMLKKPERHYRSFYFRKRSGGLREINSPRTFLKVVQWWILDTILYNERPHAAAHGFVPYKSFITNARAHLGSTNVLNVDIKDFFPSVSDSQVYDVFSGLGYTLEVATGLTILTTLRDALPQGAPTSPMIANLILRDFDKSIGDFCSAQNLLYTRYADDITISSQSWIENHVVDYLKLQLSGMGFQINDKKTRFMGKNDRKEITGLYLGRDTVNLSADFRNSCRGWFHRICVNPRQNLEAIGKLRGTIALIRQVDGAGSRKLLAQGEQALASILKSMPETRGSDSTGANPAT